MIETSPSGSNDKQEKNKLVLCSSGATAADQIKALERALSTLDGNGDMNASAKADLKSKIQSKIAELKAG